MIFRLYSKVAVKLADERYVFDRRDLMFTDVVELENVSGYSYGEWAEELNRHSLRAMAALLHVLRKKNGIASDFETMDFRADDFGVIPLHEDGSEFTALEVLDDIQRRVREAEDPTLAAASGNGQVTTASTSPTSQGSTESARGNGKSSVTSSSGGSKPKRTKT